MKISRAAAESRHRAAGAQRVTGTAPSSTSRTLTARLTDGPGAASGSDDGQILDATLEGIDAATKEVVEIIVRVRRVNDSLLGSSEPDADPAKDHTLPDGRAYRANVGIFELRNALVVLSAEASRLERL